MADKKYDLSWLFRFGFIKWLVTGASATFLLVYLITSPVFIQPQYKSEIIVYVPLTLFSQQFDQHGIGFGSNEEIDGHIQILKSTRLLDRLDKKFNLSGTWNIDTLSVGGRERLYRKINSRIKIEKTRYNSVSVTVRHHDPEFAAKMANNIVYLGDSIKEEILLENRLSAYNFAKELYVQKQDEVRDLEDLLKELQDSNFIYNYTYRLTESNNRIRQTSVSHLESLRQLITYEAELWELNSLKNRYEAIRKGLKTPLPRTYVISYAVAAGSQAWPPRILLSLFAAVTFIILLIFFKIVKQDADSEEKGY